ncbi:hypothetical protein BKA70DRAFT_1448184 [Coprinopsis sp. MPI-PUGE-AT-0042]|nr:hypothetical protein BKA70DRAFT_1448184 [Coprinopsis sp. MPI-PUGE-AT-0042]
MDMRLRHPWRTLSHFEATEPISLQLNQQGDLLVGMKSGTLLLWNAPRDKLTLELKLPAAVSALCWMVGRGTSRSGERDPTFAAGCADGMVYIYSQISRTWDRVLKLDVTQAAPVEGISWDNYHQRLGIAAGKAFIYHISEEWTPHLLGSTRPCDSTPRYIAFLNCGDEFVLCYLESHEVCCYQLDPLTLRWATSLSTLDMQLWSNMAVILPSTISRPE